MGRLQDASPFRVGVIPPPLRQRDGLGTSEVLTKPFRLRLHRAICYLVPPTPSAPSSDRSRLASRSSAGLRWLSNHFRTHAALAIIWLGRAATSCEAPGMRTRAVSTLRNFSAW